MNTPLQYALVAADAYYDMPTIGDENSAARAIVSATEDGQVIAFPGTNNIACWLADLDVETIDVPGLGILHAGFWKAFSSIGDQLMVESPAITVGHSEGAALALLYAALLCLMGKPPKAVFAFEPPRICTDGTIAALFIAHGVQVFLSQNGNDLIPDIPRLLHNWQHPAPITHIGEALMPFPNVDDHLITNVISSLRG